jgi:hypothetical protein
LVLLVLVAIIAGCGGGTDPSSADPLSGAWLIGLGQLLGSNASCTFPSIRLTLSRSSSTLSGTYTAPGQGTCVFNGETFVGSIGDGDVVNGKVVGDSVSFDLRNSSLHFGGRRTGPGALAGTMTWQVQFQGSFLWNAALAATWTGAKGVSHAPGEPDNVTIAPGAPQLGQGDSLQLSAVVRDLLGHPVSGSAITWTSSDPAKATVSAGGRLKAVGSSGQVTITATAGDAEGTVRLTLTQRPVAIVGTPNPLVLRRHITANLAAVVVDASGHEVPNQTLGFISSRPGLVTILSTGNITTHDSVGQATITVSSGALRLVVPAEVTEPAASMTVTPQTGLLQPAGSLILNVAINDTLGFAIPGAADPHFTSLDPTILSAAPSGLVTSLGSLGVGRVRVLSGTFVDTTRFLVAPAPTLQIVSTQTVGGQPFGIGISASGLAYVADLAGRVLKGAAPGYTFTSNVQLGGFPLAVVLNAAGTRAFVARDSLNGLAVLDVAADTLVTSLPFPSGDDPLTAALSSDGSQLAVGSSSGVTLFDAQTLSPLGAVSIPAAAIFLTPHPSLLRYYASAGNHLFEIDAATLTISRTFPAFSYPAQGSVITSDGTRLYELDEGGLLHVFNLLTGLEVQQAHLRGAAAGIALDGTGTYLLITLPFDGEVEIVDRQSLISVAHLATNGAPRRIAFDPTGVTAIVPNPGGWIDFIR